MTGSCAGGDECPWQQIRAENSDEGHTWQIKTHRQSKDGDRYPVIIITTVITLYLPDII